MLRHTVPYVLYYCQDRKKERNENNSFPRIDIKPITVANDNSDAVTLPHESSFSIAIKTYFIYTQYSFYAYPTIRLIIACIQLSADTIPKFDPIRTCLRGEAASRLRLNVEGPRFEPGRRPYNKLTFNFVILDLIFYNVLLNFD